MVSILVPLPVSLTPATRATKTMPVPMGEVWRSVPANEEGQHDGSAQPHQCLPMRTKEVHHKLPSPDERMQHGDYNDESCEQDYLHHRVAKRMWTRTKFVVLSNLRLFA